MLTISTIFKSHLKNKHIKAIARLGLLLFLAFGCSEKLWSQTNYTSAGNGNWSTIAWSPAGTPGPGDNVVIMFYVS
jgi:hypothetical protein